MMIRQRYYGLMIDGPKVGQVLESGYDAHRMIEGNLTAEFVTDDADFTTDTLNVVTLYHHIIHIGPRRYGIWTYSQRYLPEDGIRAILVLIDSSSAQARLCLVP